MAFVARNTEDVYNEIANELANQSGLTALQPKPDNAQQLKEDLTKTTKTAVWRIFSYCIAFIISLFEKNLENFEQVIEDNIENNRVGSIFWLIGKSKEWQDGDNVVINEDTYEVGYEVEDISKQLIKYASVEEASTGLLLKVKKETSELTNDEYNRFVSYINRIKVAGSRITVRSVEPDKILFNMNISYTSEIDLNTLKSNVESAVTAYLSNIEFNSRLKLTSVINTILDVEGVEDVEIVSASATNYAIATPIVFTQQYQSYAGWNILDPSVSFDDMVVYVAKSNY